MAPAGMRELRTLMHLRVLRMAGSNVTDDALASLAAVSLAGLKGLTTITAAALTRVRPCTGAVMPLRCWRAGP